MEILVVLAVIAFAVVAFATGAVIAVKAFYKVPEADEALVKTGGKEPKVSTGGGLWAIPGIHKIARVSLQAIRVSIKRTGLDAVPSQDMIPAEIRGEMYVQINPQDDKAIVLAVQSLGTSNPNQMGEIVKDKVDAQVTDALRTAAFKRSFIGLNAEKKEFADDVQQMLGEDIAKLGLTLTAVSITHVTQGPFTEEAGDVIAAEGKRNVAQTVEKNRQETNQITRDAQVEVQRQDVDARQKNLDLEYTRKEAEADQARKVEEYEATQAAETKVNVLLQEQAEEEAAASQRQAIERAKIEEARRVEDAEIDKSKQIAVATAGAKAEEAKAAADQKEAEETAQRREQEAEIAKNKAVEEARIAKEQAVKVADEKRQQAIEEAEVERQEAVALRRAEEAVARATQAIKEADQKRAEEAVVTVKETAEADRRKQVEVIKAEEDAQRETIAADKDAYVAAKEAEGERDAAMRTAEAVKAEADGVAEAKRSQAQGDADALTVNATAYQMDKVTRAQADRDAAERQAEAEKLLASAILEQGEAMAEAEKLMVEAKNQIAPSLILRDVVLAAITQAPAVVHEVMAPVANVAHDVKILQVHGLGGGEEGGHGVQGLPKTILETGLAAAGAKPFLTDILKTVSEDPQVKDTVELLQGVVKGALKTGAEGIREGLVGDNGPVTDVTPATTD